MIPCVAVPSDVAALLLALRQNGFAAYVVGGCVRDSLRGVVPQDWDVTTAATPEEMLAVFRQYRTVTVGARHGTVAVLTEKRTVEITTFRTDGGYTDSRHPDNVSFVNDVTEDLKRRDFTVNAMAYNDETGLLDPFGGRADLEHRVLRAVGDAATRFSEDALRILRGLRFAATLGFTVESATARALHEAKALLKHVAAERVAVELTKLLCGENVFTVMRDFRDVIAVVLPELADTFDFEQKSPHHGYDVYTHTLHTVAAVPPDPVLRWAALLHDIGKPKAFTEDADGRGHFKRHAAYGAAISETMLTRLHMDKATVRTVTLLVAEHDRQLTPDAPCVKRALGRLGESTLLRLITLKHADNAAHGTGETDRLLRWQAVENTLQQVLKSGECYTLRDLCVKGNDITDNHLAEGADVGRCLQFLLDEVIDGRCENTRDALLRHLMVALNEGDVREL